ncbi:MAG TPA: hypothetical protein EYP25_05490 [Anaerolineae bacterium]|nr:hypothetical protein [Anaerolineae bacterium]
MDDAFAAAVHAFLRDLVTHAIATPAYAVDMTRILSLFERIHPETLGLIRTACAAAGGSPRSATPIAAAWRSFHIAARLLDDVEDNDVIHWQQGNNAAARTINLGTGFISLANLALLQTENGFSAEQYLNLSRRFHQIMLVMAEGQHLDLLPRGVRTLETYWLHIQNKSGAFFGLAVEAGAHCGGAASQETLARDDKFGYNLGVALQLINDLNGFFQENAHSDLASGKRTLPFFFITEFAPPSVRRNFQSLWRQAAYSQDARRQIRQIARDHGADAYMLAEITRLHVMAHHSLKANDDPEGHLIGYLQRWLTIPDDLLAR